MGENIREKLLHAMKYKYPVWLVYGSQNYAGIVKDVGICVDLKREHVGTSSYGLDSLVDVKVYNGPPDIGSPGEQAESKSGPDYHNPENDCPTDDSHGGMRAREIEQDKFLLVCADCGAGIRLAEGLPGVTELTWEDGNTRNDDDIDQAFRFMGGKVVRKAVYQMIRKEIDAIEQWSR